MLQPILTVDLGTGTVGQYDPPQDWKADYLGGASLAARILYDSLTPELDPLSPQAPLLFLNGLPSPYHPVFNVPRFALATREKFFLVIQSDDEKYDYEETRAFMGTLGAQEVFDVPE